MKSLITVVALLSLSASAVLAAAATQSNDATCSSNTCSSCEANAGKVTGFSVFHTLPNDTEALVQDFMALVAATRKEPGNIHYRMYTIPNQPGIVGFTESYKDVVALQAHLASEHVTSIFGHEYYKQLRSKPPNLYGPWVQVPDDKGASGEEAEMVFYWNMNCTRAHIWKIITNWRDSSWITGSPKATIVPLRKDGTVMSEAEAKNAGQLSEAEYNGGLGPVVQRRTWANGHSLDVRMVSRDDEKYVTVWQTLSELIFPTVEYDKFFVTISLAKVSEYETRLRYHVKFTMRKGTPTEGRMNLKKDFYGPRIAHYQKFFNCSDGVVYHCGKDAMHSLYESFSNPSKIPPLFASQETGTQYLSSTIGNNALPELSVEVKTVTPPVIHPASTGTGVIALEDVVLRSLAKTTVTSRVVEYAIDAWGRITSADILGDGICSETNKNKKEAAAGEREKLLEATNRYFETLELRDIEKLRALFDLEAVLKDPVGFVAPRTFDSIYTMFFKLTEKFTYTRYPLRTFVDTVNRQTIQVVDAKFVLSDGLGTLHSKPIQRFTFNDKYQIIKFEAFFKPSFFDFNKF